MFWDGYSRKNITEYKNRNIKILLYLLIFLFVFPTRWIQYCLFQFERNACAKMLGRKSAWKSKECLFETNKRLRQDAWEEKCLKIPGIPFLRRKKRLRQDVWEEKCWNYTHIYQLINIFGAGVNKLIFGWEPISGPKKFSGLRDLGRLEWGWLGEKKYYF